MGFDRSSRIWTVESGDKLWLVAQSVYGNPREYKRIFAANSPPLDDANKIEPGQKLFCPALEKTTTPLIEEIAGQQVDSSAELALQVGRENLRFVSGLQIQYGLNQAVRTLGFSIPYSLGYSIGQAVGFSVGGLPLFRGDVVNISPSVNDGAALNVECAHPAYWLQKGNHALSTQEWRNSSLEQVLRGVLGSLSFSYSTAASEAMQVPYEIVAIEESESIWAFISKLIEERGLLVQGLPNGALYFYKLELNKAPVAVFRPDGDYDLSPQYSFGDLAQFYIVKSNKEGVLRSTAENPFIRNGVTKIVNNKESSAGETAKSAQWNLARDLAAAVQFDIGNLPGLESSEGVVWQAGDLVLLQNDEIGYPAGTELRLLVQNVTLSLSGTLKTALKCVLPETRTGEQLREFPFSQS